MNTDIKKLLNDCGLAKLTNTGVDTLIIKIKKDLINKSLVRR